MSTLRSRIVRKCNPWRGVVEIEPSLRQPEAPAAVLLRWIGAFNARDLDGMLGVMDARVLLHPLRLNGLDRLYRGHAGVREWFARMEELGLEHRFVISDVRFDGEQLTAIGDLLLDPDTDPVSFWMLNRIEDGLIVAARHYLTDPEAFPGANGG